MSQLLCSLCLPLLSFKTQKRNFERFCQVQSPVNSFLTTYPYFQSNDGIVQRSENLIVFCRNVTGSFMFEIVHQDNTWPNSWVVGRTWFAKASNVESLYTSFYSFQTPLSPNLGTQLVPQIGSSGKIYFLGSYQTRRVLLAVNLDTFQFEQVGMFAEGVIVLDLLAQLRPDGITVDWYVSTSDSKTYATALNKLSFSSLPSLALIPISPISPTPIGLEASFVLPLPLRPAVNLTPVLVRNSTGWVLTTNGDKLNPRPKIVQFDAATGAVGASAVVPNTYVAATAGISGLSKCGYVFGADLNLYHVNNTLTQVAFNDELKVLDSVTTQALGYWPSTANFLMLSTDSNVVVAFGSQLAKFSVTCSAY